MKLSKLKKEFTTPSIEYRSIPFWSWNDKLSTEELLRQVNDMKKHGMGGFFMHSREGLETEYMSAEWLSSIKSVVEEANRVGMRAWLYDEDRWPSGFAGGLVTKNGPQYYIKGLTLEILTQVPKDINFDVDEKGKIIAVFYISLSKDKKKMLSYKQVFAKDELPSLLKKNQYVVIFREECSQTSDWYNGYAYSDNLSFECVQKFIEQLMKHITAPSVDTSAETTPFLAYLPMSQTFAILGLPGKHLYLSPGRLSFHSISKTDVAMT